MCKVIAVSSYKGGVAKTTSTVNIGIEMANLGKKVLLIDVDAQGDLTKSLGVKNPET
ncbi:MAG: AAA family ATPase, partial [Lachnospiraceae bacterium]|nr:AAA family ATPase [Lachnospiraceae bacterium]